MNREKITVRQLLAILAAGLFSFSGVLIETALNVTFPTLMDEFFITTSTVQWMTTGNLLMLGIFIPISSFLKRRFKTKSLFLTAGFLFSIGLITDIIAPTFIVLLTGRLLQGIGVGIALPMMYNIILEESPKHLLGLMMGCGSFITAAAPVVGPTFGGMMTQYFNWRFIFVGVLAIIVVSMIMGYVCIQNHQINQNAKLDSLGFVFISISFIALIIGLSNLDKIMITPIIPLACFIIGTLTIGYFIKHEKQESEPLIHFEIFKEKSFCLHTVAIMCLQMTTLGLGLLLPSYVQIVIGRSASDGGFVLLPGAVMGAVFSPIGGIILDKFGAKKPIFLGVLCSGLSIFMFLVFNYNLTYMLIIILYFIYNIGIGLIIGSTLTTALSHIPLQYQPDGNATIQTLMQLSGGIGTSVSAAILAFCQQGTSLYKGTQTGAFYVFLFLTVTILTVTVSQIKAFRKNKED